MSSQREQQFSAGTSPFGTVLRLLGDLAGIVLAITAVILAWDYTEAATGEVTMRIFLVGWAVAAVIIWIEFPLPFTFLASHRGQSVSRPAAPPIVQHLAMGIVIGLAVGTTDWTALQFAGWWQFWWTVPLLLAYVNLLVIRRRASRNRP